MLIPVAIRILKKQIKKRHEKIYAQK